MCGHRGMPRVQGSRSYANNINSRPFCGRLNFATHCFVEAGQLHLSTKIDGTWVAAGALAPCDHFLASCRMRDIGQKWTLGYPFPKQTLPC